MNSLLFYIIASGVSLGLFITAYQLLLKNNTRFNLCRFYLISAILFSFIIPFITIDVGINFVEKKEVIGYQSNVVPVQNFEVQEPTAEPIQIEKNTWNIDYTRIVGMVFLTISLLLFARLIFRFGSIILIQTSGNRYENENGTNLIFTDRTDNAFSFLGSIFINPLKFTDEEKRLIIEHEREHIRHLHSIDLILIELLIVLQWFNPFAYIARRKLIEIHEFIADNGVIRKGADPYSYQNLLLSVVSSSCLPTVGNQLSALITKKRIVMIGKPLTQTGNWTKFLVLVPITLVLIIGISAFSPTKPKDENQDDKKSTLLEKAKKEGIKNSIQEIFYELNPNEYQEKQTIELIGGNDYTFNFIPKTKEEGIHAYINSNIKDVAQGGVLLFSGTGKILIHVKKTSKFTLRIGNRSSISQVDLLALICNNGKHNPENDSLSNNVSVTKPNNGSGITNSNTVELKIDSDSTTFYNLKKRAIGELKNIHIADYFINLEPKKFNIYTVTLKQGCEYIFNLYANNDVSFIAAISRGKLIDNQNKLFETKLSNSGRFNFTPTETGYYVLTLENILSNKTPALMVLTYNGESKNTAEWGKSEFPGIYEGLEKADITYYQEQIKKQPLGDDEVFMVVEQMPVFENGIEGEFPKWIASNLQYPKEATEKGIQGKVFVQFVIEKDGSVSNAKVMRGVAPAHDKEALRVVMSSPKWKPAMQNGKNVRVYWTTPVIFNVIEEKKTTQTTDLQISDEQTFKILEKRAEDEAKGTYLKDFKMQIAPGANQKYSIILKKGIAYSFYLFSSNKEDLLNTRIDRTLPDESTINEKTVDFSYSSNFTFIPEVTAAYHLSTKNLSSKSANSIIYLTLK